MSVDNFPLVQDQWAMAVKTETSTGSAIAISATDGAFFAYKVSEGIQDETEMIARPGAGSSDNLAGVVGKYWASIEFEIDLMGKGSSGVATYMSTLLGACGVNFSGGTGSPITGEDQADTVTIGYYADGLFQSLAGAMGTFSTVWNAGQIARLRFKFWGVPQAESDVALITPTFPTLLPPRWAGTTNTYDSYALKASQMTFDVQNTIIPREDPSNAAGVRSACLVHRDPYFEFDPEAVLVATKNWQTYFRNSTEAALTVAIGTSASNTITLASTKAVVAQPPNMVNRNGLVARTLRIMPVRNASTYDSAFTITFS